MRHITYSEARKNLASLLDEVNADAAPVLITRQRGGHAVLISESEFDGMMETLHLLSSPRNAERLLRSIADAEAGRAEPMTLTTPVDPDDFDIDIIDAESLPPRSETA